MNNFIIIYRIINEGESIFKWCIFLAQFYHLKCNVFVLQKYIHGNYADYLIFFYYVYYLKCLIILQKLNFFYARKIMVVQLNTKFLYNVFGPGNGKSCRRNLSFSNLLQIKYNQYIFTKDFTRCIKAVFFVFTFFDNVKFE